ncbi:hypothetical protein OHS33_02995 [Streptomyces sp. NBC_00536]|uniref:hypothetical protein n=1 Tax=Streptomyces sp. NBC_00536 TaxID=2975769 RepID=UPI002E818AF4|nr:hypothetical protein [Streptomyces sp. NBC_00536]WUC77404.1 hypothetical protein OHS33_02995 [Streptomyces sp. NBC_00536]
MINTNNMTVEQVEQFADAWQHINDASPAAEADPLVLDCARRLAADPGGDRAHVWVSGLVAMSGYLAWRPGAAAERAALDALRAAAKALDSRACSHDGHPYEAAMDSVEDEVWQGDTGLLTGELAARDGGVDAERVLCPRNVAGWARLVTDVLAPLTVRRIPVGAPEDHQSRIDDLSGIVSDYPYCEPDEVLADEAGRLPSRPTRGVLAGYLVTMNATCWYAASERITERSVPEAMIEGIRAALALLSDGECTHGPGEHPDTGDPEHLAQVGYFLRSPGGRAEIAEHHGWDAEEEGDEGDEEGEPLDAWVCAAFLRGLGQEALGALTDALANTSDPIAEPA